jgi:hypothetical protein
MVAIGVLVAAAMLSHSRQTPPPSGKGEPATGMRAFGPVHPRLSPDARDVVFSYQGSIWRMPAAGGAMRRLASGAGFAVEPCWSPDGKRIAYLQSKGGGGGQIKVIDAQTGAAEASPGGIFGTGKLAFGPDGNRLYGYLRTDKQLEALRGVELNTGEMKTVVRHKTVRPLPWALSADGKFIAYITTMDVADEQGGNFGPHVDVWKAAIEGTGEPERLFRFPARIHDLCWTANGKALIVSTELGGVHNDLYRIDLDNSDRPTKLTFGQADEDRPSLSADGRWLLYTDNKEGATALVVHDLRTGTGQSPAVSKLDYAVPTGRVRLKFTDATTRQPAVARVSLQHKDGSFHAPVGAMWRINRDYGHFHVENEVELEVPAGAYELRAFHGPEYRIARRALEVKANQTAEQTVALERWVDANALGWYSGDNHIHANYGYGEWYNTPAHLAQMCAAEGLNIGNFMVANSDSDGVFDREFFRGGPDPFSRPSHILYWNEEFRSTIWGHMTLVNLKQVVEPVFTGFKDTTNPWDIPTMSEIADRTHVQGGVVNYTHPSARIDDLYRGNYTAKGLPIYAALAKIDTMDAMGSNDQASTALYHKLLNCGFRLTASAGTDCFLNRIRSFPPGTERAYVKIDGPLTYQKWIDGLRTGRSFVSNGPILQLTVAGKGLGDTLELKGAGQVKVEAKITSIHPLDKIEVLYNGKTAALATQAKDGLTTDFVPMIQVDRSGWIALQVSGPVQPEIKGPAIFAVTSPVYVNVGGEPAGSGEDARYFLAWIDRLWETVQARDRIPSPQLKAQVQAQVAQARAVYRKILEREEKK